MASKQETPTSQHYLVLSARPLGSPKQRTQTLLLEELDPAQAAKKRKLLQNIAAIEEELGQRFPMRNSKPSQSQAAQSKAHDQELIERGVSGLKQQAQGIRGIQSSEEIPIEYKATPGCIITPEDLSMLKRSLVNSISRRGDYARRTKP